MVRACRASWISRHASALLHATRDRSVASDKLPQRIIRPLSKPTCQPIQHMGRQQLAAVQMPPKPGRVLYHQERRTRHRAPARSPRPAATPAQRYPPQQAPVQNTPHTSPKHRRHRQVPQQPCHRRGAARQPKSGPTPPRAWRPANIPTHQPAGPSMISPCRQSQQQAVHGQVAQRFRCHDIPVCVAS